MIRQAAKTLRRQGLSGVVAAVRTRALGQHCPTLARRRTEGKVGLEIGGPTFTAFARDGFLPVYPWAQQVDNCNPTNYSKSGNTLASGQNFCFDPGRPNGWQYLCEGGVLGPIADQGYDFVLSSHSIEHMANPLGAIKEWTRILRFGGSIILIVPHMDGTFDHRRPLTPLSHLISDYQNQTPETDTTHIDEMLSLYDPPPGPNWHTREQLRELSKDNATNRHVHHHTFNARSVAAMVDFSGLQIRGLAIVQAFHIVVIADKLRDSRRRNNKRFLSPRHHAFLSSPFPSDRANI